MALRVNKRLHILNVEPDDYSAEARDILLDVGTVDEKRLTRDALLQEIGNYDAMIVRLGHRIDEQILAAAPRMSVIVSATTGLDHIDVAAAQRRGVKVLSLRGERDFLNSVSATAEHNWGLLLAVLRRIPAAHQAVLGGQWDRDRFRGRQLRGLRLGIVGLGRLGNMTARYAAAFGMRVVGYDPHATDWPAEVGRCGTLLDLAHQSDALSIHVPLSDATRGLIGAAELAALPRGAVVINTSRGAIVDEAALAAEIEAGRLAGAGLDVLDGESDIRQTPNSPLVRLAQRHPAVVITPHIGGATTDSMRDTEIFMARRLVQFIKEGRSGHA